MKLDSKRTLLLSIFSLSILIVGILPVVTPQINKPENVQNKSSIDDSIEKSPSDKIQDIEVDVEFQEIFIQSPFEDVQINLHVKVLIMGCKENRKGKVKSITIHKVFHGRQVDAQYDLETGEIVDLYELATQLVETKIAEGDKWLKPIVVKNYVIERIWWQFFEKDDESNIPPHAVISLDGMVIPPSTVIALPVNQEYNWDGLASWDEDGTIILYSWNFGDGNMATGAEVTHTYSMVLDTLLTLTATDDRGGTDSVSVIILVR
ncbi:MAG: PKD domain-containing protein [Candidatus Hodarchaeales archaeon]|jgi:hypothetical protein